MSRVAVFGGTAEGRELGRRLAAWGAEVGMFVATPYGEDLVEPAEGLTVFAGRLDREQMADRLSESSWDAVVDATHPYAAEATANIRAACRELGLPYHRLSRKGAAGGLRAVASAGEAAALLETIPGNVLLTVGSKELAAFTAVTGCRERLFARVLPDPAVMESCRELGFRGRNLIGMQGPFTTEMNAATIRMLDIQTLVTKDSGAAGGVPEKLAAAAQTGTRVVLIGRPSKEEGQSLREILFLLKSRLNLPVRRGGEAPVPRFPLFVELRDRPVLVVGGGAVAARRVKTLLRFGAAVTVVSPQLCPELESLSGRFAWEQAAYKSLTGNWALIVAATGDRAVNRRAGEEARAAGIPVSVADRREESTFWFPAVVRKDNLVAGIVSTDGDHRAVKEGAAEIRRIWEGKGGSSS